MNSRHLRRRFVVVGATVAVLSGTALLTRRELRPQAAMRDEHAREVPEWAHVSPEQKAAASAMGVEVAFENPIGMRLVFVPPGKFGMGSRETEVLRNDDEDRHQVELTRPFYVSIFETRNREYDYSRGIRHKYDHFDEPDQPVVGVSFEDALAFVTWLNERDSAHRYALPTEAQWEYAARAGSRGPFPFATIEDMATYDATFAYGGDDEGSPLANRAHKTTPVGQYRPNKWGLYDTVGNVWEWCSDWYGPYVKLSSVDPTGPTSGSERVSRGGSWGNNAWWVRSASRNHNQPTKRSEYIGFRVVAAAVRQ